ncbi:hypothetical protein FOZ62_007562, partial [Perkinsus olseni]
GSTGTKQHAGEAASYKSDDVLHLFASAGSDSSREKVKRMLQMNSAVLELGCGQGLAGMFCVQHAGASRAVLTDVSETALAMVKVNAKLNDIADRVTIAVLDVSRTLNGSERYDFVIASDMLFSSKIAREVFAACRRLIKPGGTILLGHEKRYSVYRDAETGEIRQESVDQPLQVFLGLSREENWSVQEVSPFPNEPNLIALRVDCI